MDEQDTTLLKSFEYKTVKYVVPSENHIIFYFTDGSKLEVSSRGSDEGSWLTVSE